MITQFNLPLSEIQNAVESMAGDGGQCAAFGPSSDERETQLIMFSRGVWSRLSEPGDGVAGWFIGEVGPVAALEHVLGTLNATEVCDRIFAKIRDNDQEQYFADLGGSESSSENHVRFVAELAKGLVRWRQRLNSRSSLNDFSTARHHRVGLLVPESLQWPSRLQDLGAHAPHALWYQGDSGVLKRTSVAVVGSRAASSYGEHVTAEIVLGLSKNRIVVVSGGAYGIDAIAHRTTVSTGGSTVAVFAGGIDQRYPSGHDDLFDNISRSGVLLAEQAPGGSPTKWRFLQRNRLIAALSSATVVCEAGHRSGSLNTAGHASQLARPLGAVPGPVTSAASAGCHRLLREFSAVCIRDAQDALQLLSGYEDTHPGVEEAREIPGESATHRRVIDALSLRKPRRVEEISVSSGLDFFEAQDALSELELLDLIKRTHLGWVRKT